MPKLVIRVMDSMTVFTKVTLNGQDIQATRVQFDTGEKIHPDGLVKVRIECYADIDIEMDGEMMLDTHREAPMSVTVGDDRPRPKFIKTGRV